MGYSIFRYGHPMLSEIVDIEQAKEEAMCFVSAMQSDHIEVRDSENETVSIGYFDGKRFHWSKDKTQTEAWKSFSFVTLPPLWRESKDEGKEAG